MNRVIIALALIGVIVLFSGAPAAAAPGSSITRAERYYELGKWEQALAEYERVYAEMDVPDPQLIFQIAQCHRKLDRLKVALRFYESFLAHPEVASGGHRDLVPHAERWKKEMEAAIARANAPPPPKAAAAPIPPPVASDALDRSTVTATSAGGAPPGTGSPKTETALATPPKPREGLAATSPTIAISDEARRQSIEKHAARAWPLYAGVAGGVAAGTALVFRLLGNSANDDYHGAYDRQGLIDSGALSRAETFDTVAAVAAGLALTAIGAAVVGLVLPDEEAPATAP